MGAGAPPRARSLMIAPPEVEGLTRADSENVRGCCIPSKDGGGRVSSEHVIMGHMLTITMRVET